MGKKVKAAKAAVAAGKAVARVAKAKDKKAAIAKEAGTIAGQATTAAIGLIPGGKIADKVVEKTTGKKTSEHAAGAAEKGVNYLAEGGAEKIAEGAKRTGRKVRDAAKKKAAGRREAFHAERQSAAPTPVEEPGAATTPGTFTPPSSAPAQSAQDDNKPKNPFTPPPA